MNCLHCGKKIGITFLRKARDNKFCSEEHRLQFFAQQEQIALARLIDTQVARPASKHTPSPDPPVCSFVRAPLTPGTFKFTFQPGHGPLFSGVAAAAGPRLNSRIYGGALARAPLLHLAALSPSSAAPVAVVAAAAPCSQAPRPSWPAYPHGRPQPLLAPTPGLPLPVPAASRQGRPVPQPQPERLILTHALAQPAFREEPHRALTLSCPAAVPAPLIGFPRPQPFLASARQVSPLASAPMRPPPRIGSYSLCPRKPQIRFDEDPPLAGPRDLPVRPSDLSARSWTIDSVPLPSQVSLTRTLPSQRYVHSVQQPSMAGKRAPSLPSAYPASAGWRHPVPAVQTFHWPVPRPRFESGLRVLLGSAHALSLSASLVPGLRCPMLSSSTPLPLEPHTREPHPSPVRSRQTPHLAAARPMESTVASVAFPPRTFCESPILLAVGCVRRSPVAPAVVGRAPRLGAACRPAASPVWLPAPNSPLAVPVQALVQPVALRLPGDRLSPRGKQWTPVRFNELFRYAASAVQCLPRQPNVCSRPALWFAPNVLGYPPIPRLRAASAPVSRPAARLLTIPGCTFASIAAEAAPIANLAPAVLPPESRRTIQGLKLRVGHDFTAWDDLAPWQRFAQQTNARWHNFPALPKWGAVATALLLAGFASVPGVGPAMASIGRWDVPPFIAQRAAIELTDDFRRGLAHWQGSGDWSRSWIFDRAGFIQTGPLALFRPSRKLTNYEFEFLGQIQRKGMGWVVRARDLNHYQALKLSIVGNEGVPEVVLIRYPVVSGRQGKVTERRVPLDLRQDTVYNITTRVNGSDFTVTIQGQVADYWSEPVLATGGVGLFSSKGEQARVRWVEVRHQNDTLGKLCALFAPPKQTGANP